MIKRDKFKTEMGRKLYDKLVSILDDDDFILAVLVETQGDKKKKEFLEMLEKTGMNTADEILDYLDDIYD
jgi:hypothetical protein